jgi:hypothetical protein
MAKREPRRTYNVPKKPEKELALWERRLEEGLALGQFEEGSHVHEQLTARIAALKESIEGKKGK